MQEVLLWNGELRLGGGRRGGGGGPDGLAAGGEGGEEAVEEAGRGDRQRGGGDDGERGGEPREAQQGLDGAGPAPRLHGRRAGGVGCLRLVRGGRRRCHSHKVRCNQD